MTPKQLRADYLSAFPQCQYTQAAGRYVKFPQHIHNNLSIEHVWNRKGKHSEHWSNYATVLPGPHDWKHRFSVEGRIAITHFKWRLAVAGDARHFDREALRRAAGFDVIGWVDVKLETTRLPRWCWELGAELVRGNR